MAYIDRQFLINKFGQEIADLIDRDNDQSDDPQILDQAIEAADSIVNGYIAARYSVPVAADPTNTPALIKNISAVICRYLLWDDGAPEEVRKRYEESISYLRDVAQGLIVIAEIADQVTRNQSEILVQTNERVFSMETLRDF